MPAKSSRWYGSSLSSAALTLLERLGEDHLAHRVDAVAFEEHVFGAAEADADAPNAIAFSSAPACRRWCAPTSGSPARTTSSAAGSS
jgi:hypothetical protein